MNHTGTLFNRIEILFYSTLTSGMSRVDHLRDRIQRALHFPLQPPAVDNPDSTQLTEGSQEKFFLNSWTYLSQALIPLIIWMVLGFAAGFLLGMIKPG